MYDSKKSPAFIKKCYGKAQQRLASVRKLYPKPLTLTEKIWISHLSFPEKFSEKEEFLQLLPDRVIMQDVTAQMALLQFMLAGKNSVSVRTSIHCDHLIVAKEGAEKDIKNSLTSNKEVFDFLSSTASLYNIGFWKPGAGIIHQVVLENYAFPGALIIGTDSHSPNAGGLGTLAVGVGGADAVDVMAGFPWELKKPQVIGVHLTGELSGWASPKDVILKLLGLLTVKGGTNKVIEYFGEGAKNISCTGKATITNMGAELGATSSIFPFDLKMKNYLKATLREEIAQLALQYSANLEADKEVLKDPSQYYDELIEISLSDLKPYISGPHSPDRIRTLKELKTEAKKEEWPLKLSSALIGSCTNSSYQDMGRAVDVARQAHLKNIKMPQPFLVTPGSDLVKKTIERDGYMKDFEKVGATVLANACGPCIGQWNRNLKKGETNVILNSFNRNFKGRNDANPNTLSFIASPEIVMAIGLAGRLDFDPETDELEQNGHKVKFLPPQAKELPTHFVVEKGNGYIAPTGRGEIKIRPHSQRLSLLKAFPPWDGKDLENLLILCKAEGKCTTDHISPAGFWLKYRGHLDKISNNLLLGARNSWTGEIGRGENIFIKQKAPFAEIARDYKKRGQGWVIIGGSNYGEGSSREHAAMSPRHLNCRAVLVQSFARIHETNLKKQGVLPLCFVDPSDENLFLPEDRLSITELDRLEPHSQHPVLIQHRDGSKKTIYVKHSMNAEQIEWFKAGSSLKALSNKISAGG